MLDENLNEEYINKLDGIIEFFKAEKEFDLHYIIIGEDDSKFRMTFNISIIVVLIATTNLISLVETFPEIFIQIMILFTLFLLLIIFTGDFINSKRRTKYIKESVKFNLILNFFYSLKILPYEVNLFPVINTIKKRYHVKTGFIESNQEKYFYDIWYKEIIDCLDNINKEIIKK
ncbi:MAG: hypothetical protein GQ533_00225 [Methanosarcinaceae archaeon]|nr:hypothetical protein [Methanosarcinaceae archaeon]